MEPSETTAKKASQQMDTCPAFFIGDADSDAESCPAFSIVEDGSDVESSPAFGDSDAESCHRPPRRPSVLSTTASSCFGGCSREDAADVEGKRVDLSHFQWSAVHDMLSIFSDEMVSFRQDLRSLASALDDERHERLTGQLALLLDKKCAKRLADVERLSQEGHCLSVAGLEATQTCITNVEELSSALLKETKERVELESSMHQAFQLMQKDIEQEAVERTNLGKDLKSGLEKDLALFKERCEEQEQLARHMKEIPQLASYIEKILEGVERERHDRIKDSDDTKNSLVELRADLEEARKRIDTIEDEAMTISKTPKTERDEREHAEKDIRRQLDELRMQVDGIVAKFHAKLHAVQADIEQEAIQRTSLGKDLKSSLEKDLTLFKKRCDGDQEQLARHMKDFSQLVSHIQQMRVDMLEAVEADNTWWKPL